MSRRRPSTLLALGAACFGFVLAPRPASGAEDFPVKPITLVIPFGAGGSHDLTGRALSSVASQYLGQPLIV